MASKSQPDKRQNRQRILFSFNVDLESPLGIVFQYLMRNPKLPSQMGKQKGGRSDGGVLAALCLPDERATPVMRS